MDKDAQVLTSAHVLEYPYSRSVGPVIGAFLTGLRDGKILGARGTQTRVIVPPSEYDPVTSESTGELIEVGPQGCVETWAWVEKPLLQHPLGRPFAWALIRLDGASTGLLHVIDVKTASLMRTGMRVEAEFLVPSERQGAISDLRAFVPIDGGN